jgi:nitroreductase
MDSELLALIRSRRSIRRFRPDAIPPELIAQIIEAASWAPSASNRQDWFFTLISSDRLKQEMAETVQRRWDEIFDANQSTGLLAELRRYSAGFTSFVSAPVVIVVSVMAVNAIQRALLGDAAEPTAGARASAAMAAQNLMLAAHAAGLGTCCMTGALAAGKEIARLLGLRRREIVCLVTLGYPDETPAPPPRKPVSEISAFID